MPDTPTAVSTRLAEASVPQVTITASSSITSEEINGLAADADHKRMMEVQRVAMSNDSAGVATAVEILKYLRDYPGDIVVAHKAEVALAALTGTEEVDDG